MPIFASVVDKTWEWVKEYFKSIIHLLMNLKANTSVVLFSTLQYYVHIYIFRHLIHSSTIFFFSSMIAFYLHSCYSGNTFALVQWSQSCATNLSTYIFENLFGSIFAAYIIVLEHWFSSISIWERPGLLSVYSDCAAARNSEESWFVACRD